VAAAAAVLVHLLPVSYWIVGNANLTSGFGQSAALIAMSAAIGWTFARGAWVQSAGLAVLAAIALLSHISTCALLVATMMSTAVLYRWRGGAAFARPAIAIGLAAVLAVAASVAIYYGRPQFWDAYKSAGTARADAAPAASSDQSSEAIGAGPGQRLAEGAIPTANLSSRVTGALGLVTDALGWPIISLAVVGLWRVRADRLTGRVMWAIGGWSLACGAFLIFGVLAPGGVGHQRQAMEFIARATYAGSPAAIALAAVGVAWAWERSAGLRIAACAVVGAAVVSAALQWLAWIR
jgi:hypothetical protein